MKQEITPQRAWINLLRAEVLRVDQLEQQGGFPWRAIDVARVANVGVWLATYADADGTGARPGRATLAALAGMSPDSVSRAIRVLEALGLLAVRRRPNRSSEYTLLYPASGWAGDWVTHMGLMTSRQAQWRKTRKASMDAHQSKARKASMDGVPESVHGRRPPDPESVHGHPRKASTDGFRKASADAPTTTHLPAVGDQTTHHVAAEVQQPPTGRARAKPEAIQSPLLAAVPDDEPREQIPPQQPPAPANETYRAVRDAVRHRRAGGDG